MVGNSVCPPVAAALARAQFEGSGDRGGGSEFLNEKTGRAYQPVPANVDMIVARLKEGATVDDCRAVIAKKCREWLATRR
jgi:hypothetical protein